MKRRSAFTLVELLVVIGILALLLAILAPAFDPVRKAAKRTRCLSNMRQILGAVKVYGGDFSGRMPNGTPPYSAKNPDNRDGNGNFTKVLNPYLKSMTYAVLQCSADQGSSPTDENTNFVNSGYSYWYAADGALRDSLGIAQAVGNVSYQETKIGYRITLLTQEDVRNALQYYGKGPDDVGYEDPNSGRARDITKAEIDQQAWPAVRAAMDGQAGQEGININALPTWPYRVKKQPPDNLVKWPDQFSDGCNPVPFGSRDLSKWDSGVTWSRPVYTADYWTRSGKKVLLADYDATFPFVTPSIGDTVPTSGLGFWHGYQYVPDPNWPANLNRYGVKVHLGYIDGHAEATTVHLFQKKVNDGDPDLPVLVDRNNPYY